MLSSIRKASRSWVAAILIGLLVIAFAITGISDVFRGAVGNDLAIVDGKPITAEEYRAEFGRVVKGISQQAQREVTTEEARAEGVDRRTLDEMVAERVFAAYTDDLGIQPGEEQLQAAISAIPAFQDPQTGRFSQTFYQAALQQAELTAPVFEARVRQDLARQMLLTAAMAGLKTPAVLARQTLAYATERRNVTIIPIPASLVGAPGQPTEAQVQAIYDENKARLTRPETRDVTLVTADLAAYLPNATVDEAQIRAVFDQRKDQLGTPELRSFVQIVAPDMTKARQAADRMKAGESAEAVARALNLAEPLTFTDKSARQIPDRKIADAVMAASTGDTLAVQGSLGIAAVRITSIKPAVAADYETFAAQAREEFRRQGAAQALTQATEIYDTAITDGATAADAARRAGLQLTVIKGVTAQGADIATGQPVEDFAGAQALLASVFGLAKGDATDLAPAGEDRYVAAIVDDITPSAPIPLSEVRADVVAEWQRRDLASRVEARAKTVLDAARKDGFEAAAAANNLRVQSQPEPLQRGQGGQALTNAVFSAKAGEIVMAPVANGVEFAIIRIDSIVRDNEAAAPDRLAQAEQQTRQSVQADLAAAIQKTANNSVDAKTYPERLGAVFGDTPEDGAPPTPTLPAAPAAPAPGTPPAPPRPEK